MLRIVFILFIGAGLTACSSVSVITSESTVVEVSGTLKPTNPIDSIVTPYRSELNKVMNEVVCRANQDFVKGRPNAVLNNWSADALLFFFKDSLIDNAPMMTLLNTGGLRSSINKGDVTLGDLYKLMPFDNEVVIVKLPINTLEMIASYIVASGGEPIAGATMRNKVLQLNEAVEKDYFWVVTSDYLYNGGDKMDFFKTADSVRWTSVLLRDVFIEVARIQGELEYNTEERIIFE